MNLGLFRTALLKQRNYTVENDGIFLAVMLTLNSVVHAVGENCIIVWILKRPFKPFWATSSAANNKCYPRESKAFNCAVKSFTHKGINTPKSSIVNLMSIGTVRYINYSRNIPCWAPIRLMTSRPPPYFICRKGGVTGRGVPHRCVHRFATPSGFDAKT